MRSAARASRARHPALAFTLAAAALFAAPRPATADPQACIAANERGNDLRWKSRLLDAKAELLACSAEACPEVVREECAQLVRRVDADIPTLRFAVTDARGRAVTQVTITIDGAPLAGDPSSGARAFDPGTYHLRVESPGLVPRDLDVVVRAGEKNRLVGVSLDAATPAPASTPPPRDAAIRPIPPAVWVLGGVSLVGLGAFTVFALRGKDTEACAPGCSQDQVDSLRRDYLIGDISLGVAAVSLGVATVLFLTRPEAAREIRPSP